MGDNLETFRKQYLDAAREKIMACDPTTASPSDLILQSAMLKSYDLVDRYQALTPERTAMILEMDAEDFAAWIALPRNQYAFAETLEDPVAAGIIFRDASAAEAIAASSTAMSMVAASSTAMTALIDSSVAQTALAASAVAVSVVIANTSNALPKLLADAPTMTKFAASAAAMNLLAADSAAMTLAAASVAAMTEIAASATAMTAVIASSTALGIVVASSAAMTQIAANADAIGAIIANADALTATVGSAAAMKAVAASGTAMGVVVASATALNKIAKSETARIAFAKGATLQDHAITIKNTLTAAPTSLFTRRANGATLTSIYSTQYCYIGFNTNSAYEAKIVYYTSAGLAAGKLFVFIRNAGAEDSEKTTNSYVMNIRSLQGNVLAGQKPLSESYETQEANFICVCGAYLQSGAPYTIAYAVVIFDAWEAV